MSKRTGHGRRAANRMYQPWPTFLNYENDDDFYDWYTGEYIPSPEQIYIGELEIIEMRSQSQDNDLTIEDLHK